MKNKLWFIGEHAPLSSYTLNTQADSHSDFIPTLWASRALAFFHQNAIMAGLVNQDYKQEIQNLGDTVNVQIFNNLVANTKLPDTPVTKQTAQGKKVPVTLSYHKEATFLVEDVLGAQAKLDIVDGYMRKAAIALANDVDSVLTAQYANVGTSMTVGTGATAMTEALILSGRRKLNMMEVPYEDRHIVVPDFEDMLKVDRFTANDKLGSSVAIRTGQIGMIHGFRVYEDPRIWNLVGSGGAVHNLMFHRDGILFVTRPLPLPPADSGTKGIYMEMDGVGFRLLYSYDNDYLATKITVDVLYGVKVVHHPTDQTIHKAPLIDIQTNN